MNLQTHIEAEIVERRDLASDLWTIRVRMTPRLDFQPGQYATLGLHDGTKMIERPYSIVSSPREADLEFFIELVPEGALTPHLYKLISGERIYVRKSVKGRFTFDQASSHKKHLMVATVTGVAPFVSVVRTLLLDGKEGTLSGAHQIYLLQGASRSWEFGYDKELAELERSVEWFHYVPMVSRPWEDTAWKGELGRVNERILKYVDHFGCDPSETTAYLCGHPQMIEAGKQILSARGFPKESLREEKYWVTKD